LDQHLEADGQIVHTSTGGAGTLIVAHALRYAWILVNVVKDDTNGLVFNVSLKRCIGWCISEVKKKNNKIMENMWFSH